MPGLICMTPLHGWQRGEIDDDPVIVRIKTALRRFNGRHPKPRRCRYT
jgi:hypothetical protein